MTPVAIILTILGALVGLEWILRNAFALRVWRRVFHLTPESPTYSSPPDEAPLLSVVIPAKDEEKNIGPCLQALLGQDYPKIELIVVDDRSTDRTGEIVEALAEKDARVRLRRVTELPEGWAGKGHALQQGIAESQGPWICMTDADCRMNSSRTLSVAMEHARANQTDLLSLLPRMVLGGFWEYFLQPICAGVLVVWFRPERINNPARKTAFANGQFLLLRREAYEAVGAHEAIKGSIIEDMDLARRIKSTGQRLLCVPSRGLMHVRMYTSLGDLTRGWSRIFLGCFPSVFQLTLTILVLLLRGFTLTATTIVGWSMFGSGGEPQGWWLACGIVGGAGLLAELIMTARYYRVAGSHWILGLLYPAGCLTVAGILLRTLLRRITGGNVVWKGTHYTAGEKTCRRTGDS